MANAAVVEWANEDAADMREAVGRVLARKRKSAGLSQLDVQVQTGICQATLSKIELGKCASLETYARLADVVGVTLKELLLESCSEGA